MTLINGETPDNIQVQVMVEGRGRVFFDEADDWWTTVNHMFEICINPEIERRRSAGLIDDTFSFSAAQIYQPDGRPNVVRFNEEVRGYATIKLDRPVEKGEPVLLSDFAGFERYELLEDELDGGHFTLFSLPDGFVFDFNFLRGRAKALGLIELASQYLSSAETAADISHVGPSLDNLFSACELLAKASCVLHALRGGTSRSHGAIASSINLWGKLGNIDTDFVRLFNRLANKRDSARYTASATSKDLPSIGDFDVVKREIASLRSLSEASIPRLKGEP